MELAWYSCGRGILISTVQPYIKRDLIEASRREKEAGWMNPLENKSSKLKGTSEEQTKRNNFDRDARKL